MDWFHLLWTILFAVSVSCQNLTTILPQDDDACMRNEVTFNCTIRGSQTLTELVLAWSSTEYIGQGGALRFTSESMPGMNNVSSMINGNVTAILISNTRIGGVPELVSELHVVGANQTSVITCSSELNQTSVSTTFVSSAFPGRPQSGEARERTAGSCDFQVTWDHPTNVEIFDIGSYIIYVPSRNMMNISSSTRIALTIPNCRVGNNSIQVAAMNRLGCVGPNSSHIQLSLVEIQDTPSGQLGVGAIVGIAVGVILPTLCFLGFVFVCICCVCIAANSAEESTDSEGLLHELSELHQENFHKFLMDFYIAIKKDLTEDKKSSVENLYKNMTETRTSLKRLYIKEAVKGALKTIKEEYYGENVKKVLIYLKINVPKVLLSFDKKLKDKDTDITMDSLIRAAEQNEHARGLDELMEIIDTAEPEIIEGLLLMMCKELQKCLQSEASSVEMDDSDLDQELQKSTMKWVTNLPGQTSYPSYELSSRFESGGKEFPTY